METFKPFVVLPLLLLYHVVQVNVVNDIAQLVNTLVLYGKRSVLCPLLKPPALVLT